MKGPGALPPIIKSAAHVCGHTQRFFLDNRPKRFYDQYIIIERRGVDVGSVCYGGSQLNTVAKGAARVGNTPSFMLPF